MMVADRIPGSGPTIKLDEPRKISIELVCPTCDDATWIEATMQTRVTRQTDGSGDALALRVKAPKSSHTCGQPSLGLVEGARER